MVYRALTGLACLFLAGCFEDPPPAGSNEGSTSSGATSTGERSTGSTSGEEEEPEDLLCEEDPVETGRVPADVVIIVAEDAELPEGALDGFDQNTNVAIIAPTSVTTKLLEDEGEGEDIPSWCDDGCTTGCPVREQDRVLVPYDDSMPGTAFSAFLDNEFGCVFRSPPLGMSLSEPSRHLWLFTEDPQMLIPEMISEKMIDLGLRLHVACPECGPAVPGPKSDLGQLVEQTTGTVVDSDNDDSLEDQSEALAAPRTSCIWADEEPPPLLGIVAESGASLAVHIDAVGLEFCDEVVEGPLGELESSPLFYENGDGDVELCPVACRIAQTSHADETDVYRCE